MTATALESTTCTDSRDLRFRVQGRVKADYLRHKVERYGLHGRLAAAESATDADVARAVTILDYRIAAIQDHLGTVHKAHPRAGVCPDCCVLLDQGEGPRWYLLAALPEEGLPVIASDSSLGRALMGARKGQVVEYPTPAGPRTARVLELEPPNRG